MARSPPHLSKSRYLAGLQCERRLWLGWHQPEPMIDAAPGSILAVGHEVGDHAQKLFPGGVLVGGGPREFWEAVDQTQILLADLAVTTIFEPAFEFDDVWVRVDLLERTPGGGWIINEVKSSTRVKPENIHDLAIQRYVLEGCGLCVEATKLVHVNTSYLRGKSGIDWPSYFRKVDVTADVQVAIAEVPGRVRAFHQILARQHPPERRPSSHCFEPFECEFWGRCTADKPTDWVWHLPRLSASRFAALEDLAVDSIAAIPDNFPLNSQQRRVVEAFRLGKLVIQPSLSKALSVPPGPWRFLDFETFSPAIPLYAETRPYQRIPAQWSLHIGDAGDGLAHHEFLAELSEDPRRAFCETLLAAAGQEGPVFVYSPFEGSTLKELAHQFPDLAEEIRALIARLVDLLPVVRANVDHPGFGGSNSIKAVGPVLVPSLDYDDLAEVADGGSAAAALYRLATGAFQRGESAAGVRKDLLRYCSRDTEVLANVWQALVALANGVAPASADEGVG